MADTGSGPLDADGCLALLEAWAEQGWLRRLDVALARFVASHSPQPQPQLLVATALLAQLEGQGHACLPLAQLGSDPAGLLGWGGEAQAALQALLTRLPAPADWPATLRHSPALASVDPGLVLVMSQGQGQPLVLCQDRLYLRRYWAYEQRLASQLLARVAADAAMDEADPARVAPWLARLFAGAAPGFDWQQAACAVALRGRLSVITGGPGTGKTYTAARLLALLLALSPAPDRLRIALAAPTGKAAARLRQAVETALGQLQQQLGDALPLHLLAAQLASARTLHGLLGARPGTRHLRHGPANPLEVDVLIVDEASMVHLEMMAKLLDALPPQARLVLLGDKDQLASVEAGAVLGDLCRHAQAGRYRPSTLAYLAAATGRAVLGDLADGLTDGLVDAQGPALAQQTVMLRHSQRFGGVIGALALAVNAGDAGRTQTLLRAEPGGPVAWLAPATPAQVLDLALAGRPGAPGGYQPCLALLAQRGRAADAAAHQAWVRAVLQAFDRFRVLCAVREGDWGVLGLNQAIEARLAQAGLISGRGEWYEGRPVLVTRNDADLGVFNGDIGLALRGAGAGGQPAGLRVWFADGPTLRSVSVSRLPAVETAFAMTVHKAQGSEFEHTVLVLPPEGGRSSSRELIYTGITRARSALTLVSATEDALVQGLSRSLRRSSGLAGLLGG